MLQCRTVRHQVSLVPEWKNADAGTSPIPEKGNPVWYRIAPEEVQFRNGHIQYSEAILTTTDWSTTVVTVTVRGNSTK